MLSCISVDAAELSCILLYFHACFSALYGIVVTEVMVIETIIYLSVLLTLVLASCVH